MVLLQREGWAVNHKRIFREEVLAARRTEASSGTPGVSFSLHLLVCRSSVPRVYWLPAERDFCGNSERSARRGK